MDSIDVLIMEFVNLIKPQFLILLFSLWVIGYGIKKSKAKSSLIPIIITIIGIFGALWINKWLVTPDAIFQGILCSGLAVYGHNLVKEFKEFVLEVLSKKGQA